MLGPSVRVAPYRGTHTLGSPRATRTGRRSRVEGDRRSTSSYSPAEPRSTSRGLATSPSASHPRPVPLSANAWPSSVSKRPGDANCEESAGTPGAPRPAPAATCRLAATAEPPGEAHPDTAAGLGHRHHPFAPSRPLAVRCPENRAQSMATPDRTNTTAGGKHDRGRQSGSRCLLRQTRDPPVARHGDYDHPRGRPPLRDRLRHQPHDRAPTVAFVRLVTPLFPPRERPIYRRCGPKSSTATKTATTSSMRGPPDGSPRAHGRAWRSPPPSSARVPSGERLEHGGDRRGPRRGHRAGPRVRPVVRDVGRPAHRSGGHPAPRNDELGEADEEEDRREQARRSSAAASSRAWRTAVRRGTGR